MALNTTSLPFGLRDVKIRPMAAGTETPGSDVDLPNSRKLTFAESGTSQELRGDDNIVAIHDLNSGVNWELESGGVPFEAVVAMFGGTITTTGTTPNQIKTLSKNDTDDRPYFELEGQAISDSGGDMHCLIAKCKATGELSGEMQDGNFWLTGAKGQGIGRTSDRLLYKWIQNETVTAIA